MTERTAGDGQGTNITASGLGAVIPAALIAAVLAGQIPSPAAVVDVDATALGIVVPPVAISDLLRAAQPNGQIEVTLETSAIVVRVAGLPSIRINIPEDGLRLRVGADGLRVGG